MKWRPSRRSFLLGTARLSLVAAGAGILEACANAVSKAASPGTVTPVKGGTLVESNTAEPANLSPVRGQGGISLVTNMLYDGLLTYNATGVLQPAIAKALPKTSADGLTLTFSLRDDVKWTDGTPLTADDVVFTYRLMFDSAYTAVTSQFRTGLQQYLDGVTATDAHTVVMRLKSVYAPFLGVHGTYGIVPKHVLGSLAAADINNHAYNRAPAVTNGVFKFVEWKAGDHITLARNPTYYRGAANLDGYVYQIAGNANVIADQLKTGAVHVARFSSTTVVAAIQASPDLKLVAYPQGSVLTIVFQLDPAKPASKIFSSQAVRQALYYAADRDGMADAVYLKGLGGVTADSFFPKSSWAYQTDPGLMIKNSATKAASLLEGDGWKVGAGGVREKNGVQLKFEVLSASDSPQWQQIAAILQQNWKAIGVDISIKSIPYAQLVTRITGDRAFDVIQFALLPSVDPDPSGYFAGSNAAPGGLNGGDYRNSSVDALLNQAVATFDQAKRKSLYGKVQTTLATDLPAAPLIAQNGLWCYNQRVHGMTGQEIGGLTSTGLRPFMKDVFITPS